MPKRLSEKLAGYRQDILASVVFITLGLCELIAEWLPTIESPEDRLIRELLDCRDGKSRLPGGMERLSPIDAEFVWTVVPREGHDYYMGG